MTSGRSTPKRGWPRSEPPWLGTRAPLEAGARRSRTSPAAGSVGQQGELLVDVLVGLPDRVQLLLQGALEVERLVASTEVAQRPRDHPAGDPDVGRVPDPLAGGEGLLEGVE